MEKVPAYVTLVFLLATLFSLFAIYRASGRSPVVLFVSLGWLIFQGFVGASGFYLQTDTLPPRFILMPVPPLFLIILLLVTEKGRVFLDRLDQKWLTLLHVVRIPVELVLFWLFVAGLVPKVMTFEGRNFDVFSGISAIVIYYLVFVRKQVGRKLMLFWNILCLLLLFNIVITAIISAPTPFQKIAFEQPNTGILYFPFCWLPAYIVPVVLLAHVASIRKLVLDR